MISRDEVLKAARSAAVKTPPAARDTEPTRSPGEIAVTTSTTTSPRLERIALVLSMDEENMVADILLATTALEMATDFDIVLSTEETGLPFPLVVQAELYGPIYSDQLSAHLGAVTEDIRKDIARSLTTDGLSLRGRATGTPLSDPQDPRRSSKLEELEELTTLVSECRSWLMGAPSRLRIVDPGLWLSAADVSDQMASDDRVTDIVGASEAIEDPVASIPSELFALGGAGGAARFEDWVDSLSNDQVRAMQPNVVKTLSGSRHRTEIVGGGDHDVVDAYLSMLADDGIRTVDIGVGRLGPQSKASATKLIRGRKGEVLRCSYIHSSNAVTAGVA